VTTQPQKPTIVLIHGLWLNPASWQPWIDRFSAAGHRVLAPAWPGMDASVEELNRDPSPMADVGFGDVVNHYVKILNTLDAEPVLMGHSFGGSVVQVLLSRGRGAAGVAIHPAPVKGVLRLPLSTLRSSFPVLGNPANRKRAVALTPEQWHYAFCNTMARPDSDHYYRRYHVPAPGRPLFQGASANLIPKAVTRVDFEKSDRAPLLLISSDSTDHVVPGSLVREAYGRYDSGDVDLKQFRGRPHLTCNAPGWEVVADYALGWAMAQLSGRPAPMVPAPRDAAPSEAPTAEPTG
jgi:pimeloyl-ACP methyl ester carboxylesterase